MATALIERSTEDHGPVLRYWIIPEYATHERGQLWYAVAGGAAALFISYALWTANFLFAIIVLLAAIIILVRHAERPPQLAVILYQDGMAVGQAFYSYQVLKSFWIIYEPPAVKTLYFDFQNAWRPRLPIPLQDENPLAVREVLLQYLPEDLSKEGEPTSDALSRWLRL